MSAEQPPGDRGTALVTGAARGIGAAVAQQLASDGFAVALCDVSEDGIKTVADRIVDRGGRAARYPLDVSDEDTVTATVGSVGAELGPVSVLVNNAGIIRDNLLFKMSVGDWDQVMGVHLRGSFLLARAVQSAMVERGWGRIVNISSTSALGNRGQANYSAAKAGLQGFTKTLAIELGRFGITVNAVAPGFVETEMTHETAARLGVPFEDFRVEASKAIPVGRIGVPEDIAAAVSFFVREEAGYVSGQVLYVAGGPCA
jgi:3-oxoacyl-[acyl-carrier protein] reductase